MAVIKKTLFPKNLDKFAVLVNDTQSDSKYFKITELPDTFTGGKNAFLIAGSEYLVPDTRIQIELKDSAGNIIYHEPGEGLISSSINGESFVAEYFEGVSKVVAVYVYPDTAYGPCTLTILGELNEYEDGNGILTPVPLDWESKYNVKWQKQIDVNPSLANTTKIRFYRRPTPTINELVEPIYRIEGGLKLPTGINQSFADVKLSNLETFAGDVKRVKVFRTSEGTISDYDLIQDLLVESKELLTSFGLSGSVVGNTGIFTSETLKNYWNTGSLTAQLTSSRVESGLKLNGSGLLTYTTSLDLKSTNTYELNLDAFYSSSTKSNLGLWVSYVSQSTTFSSSIGTLYGLNPTTNLLDSVFPFKIDRDYPTASLYLSQSQGEWHVGNVSLKLSQDTAFSPDEISFITTMPTVVGNETFNFKFEFYDVNNNYVPVSVTQSVLFTGGTTGSAVDTDLIISSSVSQSNALLYQVSSSISGTMTVYSSSASSSVGILSGSVSASITSLSSSVSSSNSFILSSSLSKTQQLADGKYSGSFIGDTVIYSPTIGGQQGYISQKFQVGNTNPIILDARTSTRKIYIGGANDTGSYSSGSTSVYMDSTGKFSLKDKLTWDGSNLTVVGSIDITGGTAATQISNAQSTANTATASAAAASSAANYALLNANTASIFTSTTGLINKAPTPGSTSGLYLGNRYMGYYNGSNWKTYMSSSGDFYLSGTNGYLQWNAAADSLSIKGNITATTGYIGNSTNGFLIDNSYIGNGKFTVSDGNAGVYIGNDGIALGANSTFKVLQNGALYASSATITGAVTATSLTATTTGNIAGWSFNSTTLSAGGISLNSGTPEIRMTGATSKVKIGTRNLVNLTGTDDQRTVYLGEGGVKITGDWTDASSEYKSYITLAADSSYARAIFFNSNLGYGSDMVYMYANPQANNTCLKIENGGAWIRNYNDGSGYTGNGNQGYALRLSGALLVGGTGEFTGDVTANTSDRRLKTKIVNIDSPLEKISKINGVYFNWNETAKELTGKDTEQREVGFIAQEVQSVLPEIIKPAPFDTLDSTGGSKSGENYLTIQYEKIVPLLVECIKELKNEIEELKSNR